MSHTTEPPRPAESWAEVRAHDEVVRYRRSGAGRSILLLCPDAVVSTLWPELTAALDRDFRVLVPVPPPAERLVRGLSGFLDGLGTSRVAIVATDALCVAAVELARLDPERVARAVLLPCEGDVYAGLDAALATVGPDRSVPFLIVPRIAPAAAAVSRICAFLGDPWG